MVPRVTSLGILNNIFILNTTLRPIYTQEKFPRTENVPKIRLLKVENFQLQNFFPTEICVGQYHILQMFFLRKIFLSGNEPLSIFTFLQQRDSLLRVT